MLATLATLLPNHFEIDHFPVFFFRRLWRHILSECRGEYRNNLRFISGLAINYQATDKQANKIANCSRGVFEFDSISLFMAANNFFHDFLENYIKVADFDRIGRKAGWNYRECHVFRIENKPTD